MFAFLFLGTDEMSLFVDLRPCFDFGLGGTKQIWQSLFNIDKDTHKDRVADLTQPDVFKIKHKNSGPLLGTTIFGKCLEIS